MRQTDDDVGTQRMQHRRIVAVELWLDVTTLAIFVR